MKENNEKRVRLIVGNESQNKEEPLENLSEEKSIGLEKFKKPIIISLMTIVCMGCLYLIFRSSENTTEIDEHGLNGAVPQGTNLAMPLDKGKAYEEEMLTIKNQEKQKALTTLSDYLNSEGNENGLMNTSNEEQNNEYTSNKIDRNSQNNSTLNSYRNIQSELGSFYQPSNTETTDLRREISELKTQLANKDLPQPITMNDQVELMEKSYQLAAKYLPTSKQELPVEKKQEVKEDISRLGSSAQEKQNIIAVRSINKNPVSMLFREPENHSLLIESREFITPSKLYEAEQSKNSIRACIHETQIIKGDTNVRLRLLEPAQTSQHYFPKGTLITANAKLLNGRLQLKISSIEINESIIPVELNIYDLDGQQGLSISDSQEISVVTEMAANMSQNSGASIMMTQSAGQQLASDLSRGVVQGVSGYFSKKIKTPKVTLKAGLQVLLVAKK